MHNFNKGDFCLNKITCSLVYFIDRFGNTGNLNLKQGFHSYWALWNRSYDNDIHLETF
jgi:hypothetical protein